MTPLPCRGRSVVERRGAAPAFAVRAVALLGALALGAGCAPPPHVGPEISSAGQRPASLFVFPWAWTDDQGKAFTFSQLQGSPFVVTTIYTSCTRTCPRTIEKLRSVYGAFRRRGVAAEFVVVTLDPGADSPERLREFKDSRKLPSAWHLLRGERRNTLALAGVLGIHVIDMEPHLVHDARIVVFDGSGMPKRSFACCDFDDEEAAF
jgi:cytochrome oxidase Cu insertion factor (SCO1/SenC/PrrC family)